MLTRYWFEFQYNHYSKLPIGLARGCGVTAHNYDDAIFLLEKYVFENRPVAPIKKAIENVDVSTLEAGHVLSNILPASWRGIWYPFGYNVFK
jgi:hypothetical protein